MLRMCYILYQQLLNNTPKTEKTPKHGVTYIDVERCLLCHKERYEKSKKGEKIWSFTILSDYMRGQQWWQAEHHKAVFWCVESNVVFAWFCSATCTLSDWLKKLAPLSQQIRRKSKTNILLWLACTHFPMHYADYLYFLWFLIGLLSVLFLLWLVRVITLVLVLWHSFENSSKPRVLISGTIVFSIH